MANLALFLISVTVLTITPGPDMLYVMARTLEQGRTAGVVSVLGICVGLLLHTLAATLGLSALLMTSAIAYQLVKYLGAGYLVYLGICTLLSREQQKAPNPLKRSTFTQVFWQGTLSSALNPKLALFFLAFLPQFLDPSQGPIAVQTLGLSGLFIGIGATWLLVIAVLTSQISQWLQRHPGFVRWQQHLTGGLLIGLGLHLAVSE